MSSKPEIQFARSEDALEVRLGGTWRFAGGGFPSPESLERELATGEPVRKLRFDSEAVVGWDSTFVVFLLRALRQSERKQIEVDLEGLPPGVQRLLALSARVPEQTGGRPAPVRNGLLAHVGTVSLKLGRDARDMVTFTGEIFLALTRLARGKARFQASDFLFFVQQAGAEALPIVSLISVLVGLILAFVGLVQLQLFGAEMYVADLVGIGMIREMGAMMTGIIMAGRTGAAYAAQLGTMQVNDEIDAFRTLGIDPVEFLVLPRLLALLLMLPLLCAYADLMGVLGGALVAVGSFETSFTQYVDRTQYAVALPHFWIGLLKSFIYGWVIAIAGCLRGMQCGRSSSAVGEAATSAVVTAIVGIIVWCALTTVLFNVLGI
jgi:phospholipid/cholesterol/gamma-HCH transport system permease protein